MSEPIDTQLTQNPLYRRHKERADANKPPSRSSSLGAVAQSRFPEGTNRREMVDGILAQDEELVEGHFGTVYYIPKTICGIDLKLEPLQPSIGTVIHGLDLATDLQDPRMVSFLRELLSLIHI